MEHRPHSVIAGLFALSTVCELLFAHLDRSLICMSILLSASVWHIYPGQEALYIILCTFLPSTVSISIHCLNNANECSMHGLILFATLLVVSCAWALLSSRQAEELMRDTKEAKKELRSNVSSGSQTDQQPGSSNDIRVPLSIPFKQPSSLGGKLAPVSEDRETLNLDNIKEDSPNTKPVQSSRKPPDRDKSMSLVSLIQKFPRPRSGHGSGRNSRDRNSKDRLKPPTSPFSSFANKIAKRSGSQGGLLNPCPTSSAFSSLTFHKTHKLIRKTSNDSENRKSMDHHQSCGLLFLSEKSATGSNPGAFRFFTSQDRPPGQLSEAGTFSSFNSFRAWATNPLPGSSDGYPSESLDASKKDKSDDLTTLLFSTNKSSSGAVPSPDASSQLLRAMSSRDSVDSIEELEKALSIRRAMDQAGGGTRIGRAGSQGRLGQMQKESVGADRPFVFAPAFPTAGRPPLVPNSSSFLDLGRRGSNSPMLDTVLEETSANDPSLLLSQNSSELLSINLDNIKSSRPVSKSGSNTASTQQLDKILESGQSFASSIYMYCGKDENASQYSGSSALPQNLRQGAASYWTGISQQSKPTPNGGVLDELEESILNHRRQLDEKCALLEEISIDKILGFGSMGMVYFAKMWDHQVVVKLIEHGTGLLGKEQNRGRLARVEAAVSRMLIHPNVVVTYDCCTGPMDTQRLSAATPISRGAGRSNKPKVMTVMVQEFCEGGTLRDAINKQAFGLERSSPDYNDRALRVALDIANGMRYLSMLRILHLDLKAENILLQKMPVQGNRGEAGKMTGGYVAKVADFGLAQVLPFGSDSSTSGIHGTVSHMPPEVMGQDPSFSFATDVYSFGILLFELMTGGKPFHGMAAYQVVEAVVQRNERPVWPEDESFEAMRDIAHRCVDRDPALRPTFSDIVEDLRDLIDPTRAGKANQDHSENNSVSNESDELEAALRHQKKGKKLQLAATSVMGKSQILQGTSTIIGEEAIVHDGPPKDPLGRMLYFLSSMPAFGLVQKLEPDEHSCHWSTLIQLVPEDDGNSSKRSSNLIS